jgi:hypothetical protein
MSIYDQIYDLISNLWIRYLLFSWFSKIIRDY